MKTNKRGQIVGRLIEADFQPNFLAELSGRKNLKSLDSYHSASLKRRWEMSAILNCEPGTSDQLEENQVSTSTTTQQNVFTVNKSSLRQFLPQHILTSLKAAHLTSMFFVVISRRLQGWMRTDRWAIEAQTGITCSCTFDTFHKLLFQPQAFSLSLYKKFLCSYIEEVCTETHKGLKRVTRIQCSWIFTFTIFGNLSDRYPFSTQWLPHDHHADVLRQEFCVSSLKIHR